MISEDLISIDRAASVLNTDSEEIKKLVALGILNGRISTMGLSSIIIDFSLEQEMKRRNAKTSIEALYREARRGRILDFIRISVPDFKKFENNSVSTTLKEPRNIEILPPKIDSFSRPKPKASPQVSEKIQTKETKRKTLFNGKKGEIIPIFPESKDRKFLELYLDSFSESKARASE
ncbi:MAG: hypothetical protein WC534_02945 [Candidatus Paceibacterota bacterium]